MAQTVQLKRSATENAKPTTGDLELGELAINTYDGRVYIKKSVGGTESIVQVGESSSNQFTSFQHCIFSNSGGTLSAGQTSFSGSDDNGDSLGYTAGQVYVALNGVVLDPDDFTATSGTAVVLDDAVVASDVLEVISLGTDAGSALTSFTEYEYTATANQTAFTGADDNSKTLSYDSGEELVFVNGVLLDPRSGKDYTRTSSSVITMNSGLQVNDTVVIQVYGGSNPFDRYQFDITSTTTSLTGNDANSVTLNYHPDYTAVYVNGILMQKGQWSGGDGKTITFVDPLDDVNYVVDVINYKVDAPKVRLFKDDAPYLGANLNVGSYSLVSSSGEDIKLAPTSGQVVQIDDAPLQMDIIASDPSTSTDKVQLYAKDVSGSAEMFVRDEAGNATQISPHNSEGEWVYYSENTTTGKRFKVNMENMIRKLQDITGETFIEIDE